LQRIAPKELPISTALYSTTSTIDFATRLAKALAKKLRKPAYVGGDVKFLSQEDEAFALRAVLDIVIKDVTIV